MKREVKNHAKSVKTRLLNLMNSTGYQYMYLLARYFNERLLYRVSVSSYKDNFLLKGGSLLYAFNGLETRPTVDVDFMAQNISRDPKHLEKVFREILSTTCEEDGVTIPIVSVVCRYNHPARMGDVLKVVAMIDKVPLAKLWIRQAVYNQAGELCVEGEVTLGFLSKATGRPTRCPEPLVKAIEAHINDK
jgi:acyl-CoA thioesterase FadM